MEATRISDLIFGRPCRLPLLLWILDNPKDRFFQSEPPLEIGARTAVRQELERMTRAGLLTEERPDGEARVYYVRTPGPLWEVVRAARQAIEELNPL